MALVSPSLRLIALTISVRKTITVCMRLANAAQRGQRGNQRQKQEIFLLEGGEHGQPLSRAVPMSY